MKFPYHDSNWLEIGEFLKRSVRQGQLILAPREFLREFAEVVGYGGAYAFTCEQFDFFVIHKGMLDCLMTELLTLLSQKRLEPVFANAVFVVLERGDGDTVVSQSIHYRSLLDKVELELESRNRKPSEKHKNCAAVVSTYNRPWALERSLPQVTELGIPVVVLDDGSELKHAQRNQQICLENQAFYLSLPRNRGVASAINIGISYWLADPSVQWISYHQDDTDVSPDCLQRLDQVAHDISRPILTGRAPPEYSDFGDIQINGISCKTYRDCPGHHLYAHRRYWNNILPIPTAYLGAPKQGMGLGEMGPEEDHWITAYAANSVAKNGGYVTCVPGLVRTFASRTEQSTWGRKLNHPDLDLRNNTTV